MIQQELYHYAICFNPIGFRYNADRLIFKYYYFWHKTLRASVLNKQIAVNAVNESENGTPETLSGA